MPVARSNSTPRPDVRRSKHWRPQWRKLADSCGTMNALRDFAGDVHDLKFKLGAAITRRVARASDATERRICNRHVIAAEIEHAPIKNIGIDPARLRQEFPSHGDISRIDFNAGDLGKAFAPFAAVVDDVGRNADAGAKVDDAPPCPVDREVASQAEGREERPRRAILMRRAFVPVLKNKVPLVVGDAVLGQDRLGLGMGLALLFGEFDHRAIHRS
jgi:hypothetical protein